MVTNRLMAAVEKIAMDDATLNELVTHGQAGNGAAVEEVVRAIQDDVFDQLAQLLLGQHQRHSVESERSAALMYGELQRPTRGQMPSVQEKNKALSSIHRGVVSSAQGSLRTLEGAFEGVRINQKGDSYGDTNNHSGSNDGHTPGKIVEPLQGE
jgi:hypothetical protein